jgi:hypothetical protein
MPQSLAEPKVHADAIASDRPIPSARRRSRRFLTFRLSTIFVLIAVIGGAIAYLSRPEQMEVSAIIRIPRRAKLLMVSPDDAREQELEYQRFLRAQPQLLKSPLVLSKATRSEEVRQMILKTEMRSGVPVQITPATIHSSRNP